MAAAGNGRAARLDNVDWLRSEGQGEGPQQALHFVRAHFKEYKADAPLLASTWGGTSGGMRAAGSAEQGWVVKEYRVRPE